MYAHWIDLEALVIFIGHGHKQFVDFIVTLNNKKGRRVGGEGPNSNFTALMEPQSNSKVKEQMFP